MNTWKGFKDFIVDHKVQENAYIYSFYLKPVEQNVGDLPAYRPGQFIAIRLPKEGGGYSIPRQYTLSTISNGEYYRISVKREEDGNISKLLCDTIKKGDIVQISAPTGKFVLEQGNEPVVLIGGGIGITPMLTMAYAALEQKRPAQLIYSLPNLEYYAFEEEIKALQKENNLIQSTIIYTRPTVQDREMRRYDVEGRLTKEWIMTHTDPNSKFYFCGPVEFMRTIYHYLIELGISKDNIYYELFVPGKDITKPILKE